MADLYDLDYWTTPSSIVFVAGASLLALLLFYGVTPYAPQSQEPLPTWATF